MIYKEMHPRGNLNKVCVFYHAWRHAACDGEEEEERGIQREEEDIERDQRLTR